jgi:hypothetical protein
MQLQFVVWGACVVKGRRRKPVAEVFTDQPKRAEMLFRWGTARVWVCADHKHDPEVNVRLGCPEWQREYQTGGLAQ